MIGAIFLKLWIVLIYVPLPTTMSPLPSFSLMFSPPAAGAFALPLPFPEVKSAVDSEGVIVGTSGGTGSVGESKAESGAALMRMTCESPK